MSLLGKLIEYTALLVERAILLQASESVTPEGGCISYSLYNKILYQLL